MDSTTGRFVVVHECLYLETESVLLIAHVPTATSWKNGNIMLNGEELELGQDVEVTGGHLGRNLMTADPPPENCSPTADIWRVGSNAPIPR